MAEGMRDKADSEVKNLRQPLPFLEVFCKSSGEIRRFSAGTKADFAVSLINKKLLNDCGGGENLLASHIEAVKEGEKEEVPVSFGPTSMLVDYGSGWKLQTVIGSHDEKGVHNGTMRVRTTSANGNNASHSMKTTQSPISFVYIGKILLAFLLIFAFGAAFTLVLENLPRFILYINSSI